ncbi:DNA primase [Pseudomonas phage vB_PpuP-Kurepalu-1]
MLDKRTWLHLAQELPLGRKARRGHDCGPGTVLIVEHMEEGWSAWCHRCSDKGWHPKPLPGLHERMARQAAREAQDDAIRNDPVPPMPPVFDVQEWPLEGRVWLYKAALTNEDIADLGIYYHKESNRVVIPVLDDGQLVYWQARCIDGKGPKYLNPLVEKGTVLPRYGEGECIVLTEDILSAYRCGLAASGWCLMGTNLHRNLLSRIMQDGRPVVVWLDPDWDRPGRPGQAAAAEVCRTLALAGVPHANIESKRDPKLHSRAEVAAYIQEALQRARHHASPSTQGEEGVPAAAQDREPAGL